MAFFIKLFYGNAIRENYDNRVLTNVKTSDLDDAVNKTFIELNVRGGWLPKIFGEKANKEAIKSVLRDEVHRNKAKDYQKLTPAADKILEKIRDQLYLDGKLTPQEAKKWKPSLGDIESTCREVQAKYPSFDLYEIRYILKSHWIVQKMFKSGEQAPVASFDIIHNAAKRELYESKYHFDRLNKGLSKTLGMPEAAIDREVYQRCFNRRPHPSTTDPQIRRELDELDPNLRGRGYQELLSYASLLQISSKEAHFLNTLLGKNPPLATPQMLNYLSTLIKWGPLHVDDTGPLKAKLKEKWESRFPKETFPNLQIFNKIENREGFLSQISQLKNKLDNLAGQFISTVIKEDSGKFENKDYVDILRTIRGKYGFRHATLEQVFTHLLSIGTSNLQKKTTAELLRAVKRNELFLLLHSTSDDSATRIHKYLKNPTKGQFNKLTQHDKATILKLFSTIPPGVQAPDIAKEIQTLKEHKDSFNKFTPKRNNCVADIDMEIIRYIYENYKNTLFTGNTVTNTQDLPLEIYGESVFKSVKNFAARPNVLPSIDQLIKDDIEKKSRSLNDLLVNNGINIGEVKKSIQELLDSAGNLTMTSDEVLNSILLDSFDNEFNRNTKIVFSRDGYQLICPDSSVGSTIELRSQQVTNPNLVQAAEKIPNLAGLVLAFRTFAGNDDKQTLDFLQSLCSQTVQNKLYNLIVLDELKKTLELEDSESPFHPLSCQPYFKQKEIKFENNGITLTVDVDIKTRNSMTFQDRNYELKLAIVFKETELSKWEATSIASAIQPSASKPPSEEKSILGLNLEDNTPTPSSRPVKDDYTISFNNDLKMTKILPYKEDSLVANGSEKPRVVNAQVNDDTSPLLFDNDPDHDDEDQ